MREKRRPGYNPFEFGRELGIGELVDREDEIAEVVSTIRNSGKLFLIGPRRFGKTSILKAASEQAEREGATVLRYNAEAYPSLDELLKRIVNDGAQLLAGTDTRARRKLKDVFARLEPKFSIDLEGTINASIGFKTETESENVALIVDALNGIEALAAKRDQPVGLIIDEFQKIIEIGGESAEGQIRAAIQQHRNVGYVFAGSKTRMLAEMTSHASRAFYRLGSRVFLGAVPRDQFEASIRDAFAATGVKADEESVAAILTLSEEVPYNVQRLAHAAWEYLARANRNRLTPADIAAALERMIRRDDPIYTQIWNPLSPQQKKALLATIRAKGVNLLSKDVLKDSGLPSSTMQQALRALKEKEILRDEETLGMKRLRFEDPFFAAWIEMVTR